MRNLVRDEIIMHVRRLADEGGGIPPGSGKFEAATGIKRHVWRAMWRTWTDVLVEVGLQPNTLQVAHDEEELIQSFLRLSERLDRFPNTTDLKFEGKNSPDFPSMTVFKRGGRCLHSLKSSFRVVPERKAPTCPTWLLRISLA